MSSQPGEPSEEQLRAQLEDEMRRVRVEDVLLQSVVSLVNLGARRAGLAPGTENERDIEQTRLAIDAGRALVPLVEAFAPEQATAIRDALSQLQLAYVRAGGTPPAEGGQEPPAPPPRQEQEQDPGRGPAQSSGRLWVPGQ